MNKSPLKISDTSSRVALLLKELIKRTLTYNDMLQLFNDNNKKPVYTTVVLNKYLNTLRTLGLNIKREGGKYTLLNFLVQIALSDEEVKAFNNMGKNIIKYGTSSDFQTFLEFKKKILKFMDANSQNKMNNYIETYFATPLGAKIKLLGKICDDGLMVKIRYKGEIHTVEPKQILFIENNIYFECYKPKTYLIIKIPVEKVKVISQQPVKNKNTLCKNGVVFEIYGRLISNYKLKDGERVLNETHESMVIKTENEDYELLAKRLIRYKDNCKILKPVEFIKYFEKFTNKILALYENEVT